METKELRIGNLFEYQGQYFEVDTITRAKPNPERDIWKGLVVLKSTVGFEDDSTVFVEIFADNAKLQPIPLTEEILLKLGFVFKDNAYYRSINNALDRFRIVGYDSNYHHIINFSKSIKLSYLHQLQNLYFALTGEELDVSKLINL